MYVNNIKANFGVTQEGQTVDAINLPPWANGDPYYFTFKMRELFESQPINENLHQWFDLIFGYKQRGENAIDAINVYLPITYEDGIDLTDPENLSIKDSLMNQAYNFGQCPTQLFTEPHGPKQLRKIPPIFVDPVASLQSKTFDYNKRKYGIITDIKFTNPEEFIMFGHKKLLMGMTYNHCIEGSKKEIITERNNFKKEKYDFDDSRIYLTDETPIKLMVKQDLQMVFGGFWDGKIFIQSFTKKPTIILKHHLFRVTMIEVSESEEIIITGTEKGDVVKWNRHDGKITYEKSFFHHLNTVTGACVLEDMGVFATCSKDSTVNLYTISPPYLLRSFRQPR